MPVTRFRLGVSVPASTLRGFGKRHGVTIDLNYNGGRAFYNYMTRGPGYFAHIDLAIGMPDVWNWGGMRDFLRGLLDSADSENGVCEISITLYGMNLGWEGLWEASFAELLDALGPNRSSMRFILLAGEWSYKNMQPPTDVNELKSDFLKAKEMAASYGYELGWHGEGKYLWSLPKSTWPEVISWGPRMVDGQLSRSPDPTIGAREAYETGNSPPSATDVLLCCFTMWDREANIPNTPPYYITYEKFAEFVHGAADRFDATDGAYPQSLVFEVMPETFNDVEGVDCPYLEWWFGEGKIADTYNLRTSRTPSVPIPKPPPVPIPTSPFPPYPVGVKIENEDQNLPPFQVQTGGQFYGSIYARNLHTWRAMGGIPVDVYLAKVNLKSGIWNSYPLTKEQYAQKIFVGRVTTKTDGWAFFNFTAPSEVGKYILIAQVPRTETTLEGVSDFIEFILVTTKTHRVEIRTNTKVKLNFGPSAYGPPWQGVDPERWVEPERPLWGYCGEMEWKFIVPASVTDSQGKKWAFLCWEDGSTDTERTILINKDLILEVQYLESNIGDSRMSSSISCSILPTEQYYKGEVITISGSISPPISGAVVTLTYLMSNGSYFTHRVITSSSGSYLENYIPDNLGIYYVQASWSGNEKYKGSSSSWISFSVIKRPSSVALSLSTDSIAPGEDLGISGALSPSISNATILLVYRAQGGNWITLTNLTTNQNGFFSYLWINTPLKTGTYEVKASWFGNDDYDGSYYGVPFYVVESESPLEQDFSISVDSSYMVLVVGEHEQKIVVSLRSKQGFCSDIKLSISGVPSGVITRLSPSTLALPSNGRVNATIGLYASWNSSPGNYVLRLLASGSAKEHFTEVRLKVALPTPQFKVKISPRSVNVPNLNGYNVTLSIEISSLSNYTIEPSLRVNYIPSGFEIELDEEAIVIPRLASSSKTLILRTSENPPAMGNYSFSLVCSYQDIVVGEEVTLTVIDRVPTVIRANLTPSSVQYGEHVLIRGNVLPKRFSLISIAVVFENGTEVKIMTTNTDSSGEFSQSVPIFLAEGEYNVKVSCEGDGLYLGSALNFTLKVERTSMIVTLSSNTAKVSTSETVFFEGTVRTTSGKPVQGLEVMMIISGNVGVQSFFAKTDENGTYSANVSGLSPGEYNVTSLIIGNDFYNSANSEQIKIEVYDSILPVTSNNSMSILMGIAVTNLFLAFVTIARKSRNRD